MSRARAFRKGFLAGFGPGALFVTPQLEPIGSVSSVGAVSDRPSSEPGKMTHAQVAAFTVMMERQSEFQSALDRTVLLCRICAFLGIIATLALLLARGQYAAASSLCGAGCLLTVLGAVANKRAGEGKR
jgi:hypothetical protein